MPSSSARKAKAERANSELFENVTNPFCGTLPDDLTVERTDKGLKVLNNGDGKSVAGFERKLPPSSPQVKGKDVDLAKAIDAAAKLIGKAKLPMYGGLATDVEGMRAVMALAERSSGIVDHAFSEAQYRNFKIVQSSGWVMSTISEVAQPRRPLHHCRQRHSQTASAFLRKDRLAPRLDVPRRGAEAHRGVHRQGARSLRRQELAHRRGRHAGLPRRACRRRGGLAQGALARLPRQAEQARRRHAGRDRCARRTVPQRQIRRGGLGAARAQLPLRRSRRRPIHRPGEGPHARRSDLPGLRWAAPKGR